MFNFFSDDYTPGFKNNMNFPMPTMRQDNDMFNPIKIDFPGNGRHWGNYNPGQDPEFRKRMQDRLKNAPIQPFESQKSNLFQGFNSPMSQFNPQQNNLFGGLFSGGMNSMMNPKAMKSSYLFNRR